MPVRERGQILGQCRRWRVTGDFKSLLPGTSVLRTAICPWRDVLSNRSCVRRIRVFDSWANPLSGTQTSALALNLIRTREKNEKKERKFYASLMLRPLMAIGLLIVSNVFTNFAWYGHLKHKDTQQRKVILISWFIACFEYCFQVPANRIGSQTFSTAQLKWIQEVITLLVFAVFSVMYLGEKLRWNHAVAFAFIVCAVFFMFKS